jgi:hypothetical protein
MTLPTDDRYWQPPPRISCRRVLLFLIVGVLATVIAGWVLVLKRTDPAPHVAVLDELDIPPSWELAHTEVVQQFLLGSRVERYFLVDADPGDVVDPVTQMLTTAGFILDVRKGPSDWCDTRPLSATPALACPTRLIPPCSENGPGGPTTCWISATRGQECLSVVALDRGQSEPYFRGLVRYSVGDPVRIVVRITDHYGGGLTCPGLR